MQQPGLDLRGAMFTKLESGQCYPDIANADVIGLVLIDWELFYLI